MNNGAESDLSGTSNALGSLRAPAAHWKRSFSFPVAARFVRRHSRSSVRPREGDGASSIRVNSRRSGIGRMLRRCVT